MFSYRSVPSFVYSLFIKDFFPLQLFILFPLAISPSQFGRPGDWPVSLGGEGEWAHVWAAQYVCDGYDDSGFANGCWVLVIYFPPSRPYDLAGVACFLRGAERNGMRGGFEVTCSSG